MKVLVWIWFVRLGMKLRRTAQLGWFPTLVQTEHFADLFVWIGKRGIAAPRGSTVPQTECSCGNVG